METLIAKAADMLLGYGGVGLAFFGLCLIIWKQNRNFDVQGDELKKSYDRINELQERRVTDAMALVGVGKDAAAAIDKFTEVLRERR